MNLLMWVESKTINIEVTNQFIYNAQILSQGNKGSLPGDGSVWGWIEHLREKNWWSKENEQNFLRLAKTIKF